MLRNSSGDRQSEGCTPIRKTDILIARQLGF